MIWDDRCTCDDFDDPRWVRDMHRATVFDIANIYERASRPSASAAR
jgi:hypothetical protein